MNNGNLLHVEDLVVSFPTEEGVLRAVDGVDLTLRPGETLGLVGESACGKSVTALAIMRLVPPPGRIVRGAIRFEGRDLLALRPREMREIRGGRISMIFQEPMTSLNPVFTVGYQIEEAIALHQRKRGAAARAIAVEMLRRVGIAEPERRLREYPHQMSGGMKQRVMIAMALACRPALLIADEPTTALDVTIQAQILDLLRELQRDLGMAILLITHDLGIVAGIADTVAVMYAGKVVEYAPVRALFQQPRHPYTLGLLNSLPSEALRGKRLEAIPGQVPDPFCLPPGCRFHPRCKYRREICEREEPALTTKAAGHRAACWVLE